MPKYTNKKFKRKADDTIETLYDLEKMTEREVVWPSPKTPEVSSVVQFIIDNSTGNGTFSSSNHPNVLLPTGYVRDEEVLSRDSGSEGDYTVLGVSPSITPSLACEVLITENSQNNLRRENTNSRDSSNNPQNCLREIDLSMNHNTNHHHNRTSQYMTKGGLLSEEDEEIEEEDEDYEEELSDNELNADETEAMKELGYCIHRITYIKFYNEKQDVVRCVSCNEIVGKTIRESASIMKLEFTCSYCQMTFELIGDLNMHLISHYHEQETGSVLYDDSDL